MVNILILYYSMYGNVYKMALEIAKGVEKANGNPILRRTPELMPEEITKNNPDYQKALDMQKDIPIASIEDLENKDGYLFGSPTRFGNMCAQMRNFLDKTGGLWLKNEFVGKPCGLFTSTSTIHGGQETTIINMIVNMLHYGMIVVGVPYSLPNLLKTKTGGSSYGASHVTFGNNFRELDEDEIEIARFLGERVTKVAKALKNI